MKNTNSSSTTKHALTISIDKDDIIDNVCATSAWHCAHTPALRRLTPDNERLIMLKVREGYRDMYSRIMGYTSFANFNPNASSNNVQITFELNRPYSKTLPVELQQIMLELLSSYALKTFYGEHYSYFATSWLKCRSQLILVFARDCCLEELS